MLPPTGGMRTSPHPGQHSPYGLPPDHDPMLLSPQQQKLSPTGHMAPQMNPQGMVSPGQGLVSPGQGMVSPAQGMVSPGQGLVSPGQGFSPQNSMTAAQQQRPMHLPVGNQQGYGIRQSPQGFGQDMGFQQGAMQSPGTMPGPPVAAKQQVLQSPGGTMPGVMQAPGGRVQHHDGYVSWDLFPRYSSGSLFFRIAVLLLCPFINILLLKLTMSVGPSS